MVVYNDCEQNIKQREHLLEREDSNNVKTGKKSQKKKQKATMYLNEIL